MYYMRGLKLPLVSGTTRPIATRTTQIVKTCISSLLIVDMSVSRVSFPWGKKNYCTRDESLYHAYLLGKYII